MDRVDGGVDVEELGVGDTSWVMEGVTGVLLASEWNAPVLWVVKPFAPSFLSWFGSS